MYFHLFVQIHNGLTKVRRFDLEMRNTIGLTVHTHTQTVKQIRGMDRVICANYRLISFYISTHHDDNVILLLLLHRLTKQSAAKHRASRCTRVFFFSTRNGLQTVRCLYGHFSMIIYRDNYIMINTTSVNYTPTFDLQPGFGDC